MTHRCSTMVLSLLLIGTALLLLACKDGSPARQSDRGGKEGAPGPPKIDGKDRQYLEFGKVLPAQAYADPDFTNPHITVAHAVHRCSRGETLSLLKQMPHVEQDETLGRAFVTFVKEFGPDLERYRDRRVWLRFRAYDLNDATSVWYYYLADSEWRNLPHSPWVSLHRSRSTGLCALTGIFLHDPELGELRDMPQGLVTELPE